ncbi:MAG: hypothetical protein EOO11_23425 [Chitinophagaceae bacterium]|nr:MAG: hypothetical protein EOO11_23425 [Chitinophagaceae bacterium]
MQTMLAQHLQAPVAGSQLQSVTVGTSVGLFEHYNYRFRLRVYDWDPVAQRPGEELTDADIQVQGSRRNITVRLDSFGITLPQRDFIVAVEWLWLPENAHPFGTSGGTCYYPGIRFKANDPRAGESWAYSTVWGGWTSTHHFRNEKTSAAISAVVRY